ncbi:hypothetical protein CTAM01_04257 [Colletotrichum tamarilloi]|uniref:Uncharacterized protein n=1 Tax=Colletotrichum tamarilloi TaxID=1209934 RepID=A0ABQ9RHL9_9PEZI|nr:uncharacterized protein CTAM01_04257 [Colletotrichum tamarilloi]KAK1504027.1 hypothetical protein CTAM01_04257 [Colletotrichum tamarilloi]
MPVGGGNFGEQKCKRLWSEGAGGQWLLTGSRFKVEMHLRLGGQKGWKEKLLPPAAALLCSQCSTYSFLLAPAASRLLGIGTWIRTVRPAVRPSVSAGPSVKLYDVRHLFPLHHPPPAANPVTRHHTAST